MATPPTALPNISSIGTPDAPVEVIYVKIIQKLENLSYKLSTMGVGAETYTGQTFDTGTNAIAHIENVTAAGTFTSTGPAQINNTLGVTGTATMAAITASGRITANGGVTAGGHFKMGTWNLSEAGGNVGIGFSGPNVTCSANITVTGEAIFNSEIDANAKLKMGTNYIGYGPTAAKGLGFNASDAATFTESLVVNDNITSSTGKIRTNSVFNVSGTDGWTGTFDKTIDNTITFAGGIVTGKT